MLGRPVQRLETDQALPPLSHRVEPLSADGRPSRLVLATAGPKEQEHPQMSRADTLTAQKASPGHLGVLLMGTVLLTYPGTEPLLS